MGLLPLGSCIGLSKMKNLNELIEEDLRGDVARDPAMAKQYIEKANLSLQQSNREMAIMLYTAALRVDPNNREAKIGCNYTRGIDALERGELYSSIACLNEVIALNPHFRSAQDLFRMAVILSNDWFSLGDMGILATDATKPTEEHINRANHIQEVVLSDRTFDGSYKADDCYNLSAKIVLGRQNNILRSRGLENTWGVDTDNHYQTKINLLISENANWKHNLEVWFCIGEKHGQPRIVRPYVNHDQEVANGYLCQRFDEDFLGTLSLCDIANPLIKAYSSTPVDFWVPKKDSIRRFLNPNNPLDYEDVYPIIIHIWEVPMNHKLTVDYKGSVHYQPQGLAKLLTLKCDESYTGQIQFKGEGGTAWVVSNGRIIMWKVSNPEYTYQASS